MAEHEQIQQLEQRLHRWEETIADLERKLDHVDSKLRESYQAEIDELRQKKRTAEQRLAEARLEEAESWMDEDLQAAVFNIFDEIGKRLDHLTSRIRKH